MRAGRKIITYITTSADGYIARPDGDVAWLDRPRPRGNYGMGAFVIPTFIGEGLPLIAPRHRLVRSTLRSSRRFPDGVVRLHYAVARGGAKASRSG